MCKKYTSFPKMMANYLEYVTMVTIRFVYSQIKIFQDRVLDF